MGSDFDSACCLQDLTELHKERQCLEKQHQQEVNKLNQELQQARTLHNGLQAQADKVNIKVINKTKEKQSFCSSVRKYTYGLFFFPQLCYFLLCLVSFSSGVLYPKIFCCLYQGLKIFQHFMTSFAPCFTVLLSVFFSSVSFPKPSSLLLPPLGFSPMERLSYEGNDRTTMLDGAASNTDG